MWIFLCWCSVLRWIWCLWCYSWVYIHTGQAWKICMSTVGIEPTTFGILAQCSANWATRSGRFEYVIFRNRVYSVLYIPWSVYKLSFFKKCMIVNVYVKHPQNTHACPRVSPIYGGTVLIWATDHDTTTVSLASNYKYFLLFFLEQIKYLNLHFGNLSFCCN